MFTPYLRDHDRLRDLAARIRTILNGPRLPNHALLKELRAELHALLAEHIQGESEMVSTLLTSDSRASMITLSTRVETRSNSWLDTYKRHCERWPIGSAADDWSAFSKESIRLLDMMLAQINWEEQDLYPAIVAIAQTAAEFQKARH